MVEIAGGILLTMVALFVLSIVLAMIAERPTKVVSVAKERPKNLNRTIVKVVLLVCFMLALVTLK